MSDENVEVVVVTVLHHEVYKKFEDSLIQPYVTGSTTPEQVAFSLGVQHVLKRLRDGLVIKR